FPYKTRILVQKLLRLAHRCTSRNGEKQERKLPSQTEAPHRLRRDPEKVPSYTPLRSKEFPIITIIITLVILIGSENHTDGARGKIVDFPPYHRAHIETVVRAA